MSDIINATDASFDADVLESVLPVLVDFWAPWCGPCRQIAPVIEELAKEYEGQVRIVKVDVQDHPEVAAKLGIRSIPTLKTFKAGQEVGTQVGAANKQQLANLIDQAL
ncbi:MAG: thioredoxin [Alcaligenaceae bacterium]|jgi:thioredoxin 1|nr:thioredoxin [Alcaligenaceae bacterium]